MKEILGLIEKVYNSIRDKEFEIDKTLANAREIEAAIKDRENRVVDIESAQVILDKIKIEKEQTVKVLSDIVEERVRFENYIKIERQKLADETGKLATLQDEKRELFAGQQTLEKEKKEYKAKIEALLIDHYKNTDGNNGR